MLSASYLATKPDMMLYSIINIGDDSRPKTADELIFLTGEDQIDVSGAHLPKTSETPAAASKALPGPKQKHPAPPTAAAGASAALTWPQLSLIACAGAIVLAISYKLVQKRRIAEDRVITDDGWYKYETEATVEDSHMEEISWARPLIRSSTFSEQPTEPETPRCSPEKPRGRQHSRGMSGSLVKRKENDLIGAAPAGKPSSPPKRGCSVTPAGSALIMKPVGIDNKAGLSRFLEDYMNCLDYKMKNSFSDRAEAMMRMQEGYEPHYLKFETALGQTAGIALINMDRAVDKDFRAYIRHISVKNRANFAEVLQKTIDFAWTKMLADHIRVDLFHMKDESASGSSLFTDNEIKDALAMNRRGFRWKTL